MVSPCWGLLSDDAPGEPFRTVGRRSWRTPVAQRHHRSLPGGTAWALGRRPAIPDGRDVLELTCLSAASSAWPRASPIRGFRSPGLTARCAGLSDCTASTRCGSCRLRQQDFPFQARWRPGQRHPREGDRQPGVRHPSHHSALRSPARRSERTLRHPSDAAGPACLAHLRSGHHQVLTPTTAHDRKAVTVQQEPHGGARRCPHRRVPRHDRSSPP